MRLRAGAHAATLMKGVGARWKTTTDGWALGPPVSESGEKQEREGVSGEKALSCGGKGKNRGGRRLRVGARRMGLCWASTIANQGEGGKSVVEAFQILIIF